YSLTMNMTVANSHLNGLKRTLPPGSQPARIAWKAKSSNAGKHGTYVVVGDDTITSSKSVFFVYFRNDGNIVQYTASGELDIPYSADTWYSLEVLIDWTNKTTSLSVNGVPKGSLPFRDATMGSITQIHLYSYETGPIGNWDDIVVGDAPTTATAPTNSITSPADGAWFSTAALLVRGTASKGTTNIARILYGINGGAVTNVASGTTNWNFFFTHTAITNVITVLAEDVNGVPSAPVTRTYVYSGPQPLTFNVVGNGHVSPVSTITSDLVVGRSYTLTAIPNDVNSAFVKWTDNLPPQQSLLPLTVNTVKTFTMSPGLALTATFTNNPFVNAAGIYYGLFTNASGTDMASSGFFRLVLDQRALFTCQLWVNNHPVTFVGRFNLTGQGIADGTVLPTSGSTALDFNLQANFDGTMDGTVAANSEGETWLSSIHAVKVATNTPFAGKYNLVIPGYNTFFPGNNAQTNPVPFGLGFASVNISDSGAVSAGGELCDGVAYHTLASGISQNGEMPFYALASNEGSGARVKTFRSLICGWLQFADAGNSAPVLQGLKTSKTPRQHPAFAAARSIFQADMPITSARASLNLQSSNVVLGQLTWIKTPSRTLYPAGFTNYTFGVGCAYDGVAPEFPDGVAFFAGPSLTNSYLLYQAPFLSGQFTITDTNIVDNPTYNSLLGRLSGRCLLLDINKPLPYRSVSLPLFNFVGGYFIDSTESGIFLSGPPINNTPSRQ
ncbi:MAG: hypothetical protein RLZZ350_1806, partial [Verrucomicrobiota bacterium]